MATALAVLVGAGFAVAPQPASAVDVYTTPGTHTVNGRQWKTACANYSSSVVRCTTQIWATKVVYTGGKYVPTNGWVFNNLTYKNSPRSTWETFNPLVTPGEHTVAGRKWKTECYTAWTGSDGCRSQIWASIITQVNGRYQYVAQWVFNNQVHIPQVACPIPLATIRAGVSLPSIAPIGCTVSRTNSSWAAVEYVTRDTQAGKYVETSFFRKSGTRWTLAARSGVTAAHICTWYRAAGIPLDLVRTVSYCYNS